MRLLFPLNNGYGKRSFGQVMTLWQIQHSSYVIDLSTSPPSPGRRKGEKTEKREDNGSPRIEFGVGF